MVFFVEDEQVWKCYKHPSKRRKTGICPKCLRERLLTLCPNCATARPCACSPAPVPINSPSSSSSSSTSFSLFSFSGSRRDTGNGDASRLTNNLEVDPSLRKSRSVAISFLRSRSRYVGNGGCDAEIDARNGKPLPAAKVSRSKVNFWSVFTANKSKKCDLHDDESHGTEEELKKCDGEIAGDDNPVIMRSRSVAVGGGNRFAPANSKQKGWHFPSPINAFRHSKSPRSVTVT